MYIKHFDANWDYILQIMILFVYLAIEYKKTKYFIGSILYLSFLLTNERIGFPAKYFCILGLPPLWYLIYINFIQWCRKYTFLIIFGTNLHYIWHHN